MKDPEKTLFYTYDKTGNIVKVEEQSGTGAKTVKVLYAYDSLGQLIREDNKWTGRTVTYTYDQGGNMLKKRYYPYAEGGNLGTEYTSESRNYGYSTGIWKDQITSFNGEGIGSYDAVGNPCSYRGKTLTWTDGRKLKEVKNGNTVMAAYTYDQSGIRIKKTVGGDVTKFHTDNDRVLIMEKGGKEVHFLYDQDGSLFSMKVVSGTSVTDYYYEKDLQGDVVGLIDSTGTRKVNYSYDSWGRPVIMTDNSGTGAGSLNPFRYRGYFYDDETGWYYLKSRYYDPEVGRFINADAYITTGQGFRSYNMYLYCLDNPINFTDSLGEKAVPTWELLGFQYNGTMGDLRNLENGLPPQDYTNWLKSQSEKKTNIVRHKQGDVTVSVVGVTNIQSGKTFDKYKEKSKEHIKAPWGGGLTAYIITTAVDKLGTGKYNIPFLGGALVVYDLGTIWAAYAAELDMTNFENAMNSGQSVLIVRWERSGGPRDETVSWISYHAWDENEWIY